MRRCAYGPCILFLESLRMRCLRRLPHRAVRYVAWLCLFLMLFPGFVVAAGTPPTGAVPVVTNISGAVSVRGRDGVSRDVLSSRIIHSGDTLITGVDSLALVNLADVGSVRIGPASTAMASVSASSLFVNISSGSACAQALSRGVTIAAGLLTFAADDQTAIFSLIRDSNTTTIAVYQGSLTARLGKSSSSKPITFNAGEAAISSGNGALQHVALDSVQPSFAALKCPDDDVIARIMPTPAPSGGHGGGGAGGILAALLGLGAIAAAAGGHGGGGGGGGSSPPTAPPSIPPGTLGVNPGSLSFLVAGPTQTFTASESSYSGPINAASNDTSVATVSPASSPGQGPVTFTVTPVGQGSTTIAVTDNHGGSQSVSITVTPPGDLSVNPGSLTFVLPGGSQTFKASESSYTGAITAHSNDQTVATVSGSGNGPGPVTFTVSPVGAGTTTITVHGGAAPATVNITVIGPLTTDKGSLTFLGTTNNQNFTASDPSYTGALTAMSGDITVATVSPASHGGPQATFTVTPVASGNTSITVSDTLGGSATVNVSVSTGGLTVNPTSLTLTVGGSTQTFTGSEANYTGRISASSNDTGKATVSPAFGPGPGPVLFTVTPVSAGNPAIAVTDNHGGGPIFVNLTITGPLTSPANVTFDGSSSSPQNVNVSDPNYSGSITASSSDASVATVNSPQNGPNATFSVTPKKQGTATLTFTDANNGSDTTLVTVNPGSLTVSTSSVTLNGAGDTAPFTSSERFYTGAISAATGDNTVATVSPASGTGPGPVSFTITAVGPGTTNITVTDNHGGSQPIGVAVNATPVLSPGSLSFTDVGTGKPVTISEPGYNGNLTRTGDTCGAMGIATVLPNPVAISGTITVTPSSTASGGTCQFAYKDSFGNTSSPVSVTVGPFGPVSPNPTSLTFMDVGAGNAQTFTASETKYSGQLTIDASACAGIATVSPNSGASGTTFTVTPVGSGGPCDVNISDDHTQSATVSVTVGPFGPIMPSVPSLPLKVGGSNGTFTVSESGYNGNFTIDQSSCTSSGAAIVSPGSGNSSQPFTVTPLVAGNCGIIVNDDHSGIPVTIDVFVTAGTITVTPNTLQFPANSSGNTMTFVASDSACGVLDTMIATADGTVAQSVSPPGIQLCQGVGVTYTVTAGSNGRGFVTVIDTAGGSATVSVGVGMSPLNKKHHPVGLHKGIPSAPGHTRPGGIRTPLPLPIPLRPGSPGTPIGGGASPPSASNDLLETSASTLMLVSSGPAQSVRVSEAGYARQFTILSSNASVALTSVQTAAGPTVTVTISPRAAGTATIRITDDHGGVQTIQVIVRPNGPKSPPLQRF